MNGGTDQATAQCEAEPTNLRLGVQLQGLTKIYKTGNKVIVSRISNKKIQ